MSTLYWNQGLSQNTCNPLCNHSFHHSESTWFSVTYCQCISPSQKLVELCLEIKGKDSRQDRQRGVIAAHQIAPVYRNVDYSCSKVYI